MMFGFYPNRELMGGGGGSSGGGGGRGGVGSNTPGSPGAADGNRGSSMGAGGGTAGPSGGSGGSNRGGSTNPGRPGGESGERGSAAPGGRGSNSGGPGRDTPGAPDASDGKRGSTMGRDGGLAGSSSSSGGSESISGSRQARSRFSFNSPDAGQMMSFGESRDTGRGPVGGFRGTSMMSGDRNFGGTNGAVTDGLDTTTKAYQMIVGDDSDDSEGPGRTKTVGRPSVNANEDQAIGDIFGGGLNILGEKQKEATDEGPGRGLALGLLGLGPLEMAFDAFENYQAGKEASKEISALAESYAMSPEEAGVVTDSGQLARGVQFSSFPGADTQETLGKTLIGEAGLNDGTRGLDGKNGGAPPPEEVIPPIQQQPTRPAPPAQSQRFGGSFGNYGSYARRFFSRT